MGQIDRLWIATLTRNTAYSGTKLRKLRHPLGIIINSDGRDVVYSAILTSLSSGNGMKRGQANIYFQNVQQIDTDRLTNSSVRIYNDSGNLWRPEDVVVWGDRNNGADVSSVAIALNQDKTLGTEEGRISMPVSKIGSGNSRSIVHEVIVLIATSKAKNSGTDDHIRLQITNNSGAQVVNFNVPNTSQDDLEKGQCNIYRGIVNLPFSKLDLNSSSIRLFIDGDDRWRPRSFFVFGLAIDPPTAVRSDLVPLVYIPEWDLGLMSTDMSVGKPSRRLPIFAG